MKNLINILKENKTLLMGAGIAGGLVALAVIVFVIRFISPPEEDILLLKPTVFEKLDGWKRDNQLRSVSTFKKSCDRILKKNPESEFGRGGFAGSTKDWQNVCVKLGMQDFKTVSDARKFFEDNFNVYEAWGNQGVNGLFTGYYEPTLYGSLTKTEKYKYPIYARPESMLKVDLGLFHEDLKGRKITGRVDGTTLKPFYVREDIEAGALENQNHEIVWADNAVDVFFLHIQGSGRVVLDNGEILRIGYADQNGHGYKAIGRDLIHMGAIPREEISMQSIRKWLEENPEQAQDIMNINQSYVFFRILDIEGEGPLGAEGISLTPKRSIAIDRRKIPYGTPIWLDAEMPSEEILEKENDVRIQSLMVAQDTGGAIKGAVRGDFFWGAGADAAYNAGLMKSKGRAWIFVPKTVQIAKDKIRKSLF